VAELRWLLLGLGLVVVAGLYLYTRYQPRLQRGLDAIRTRREPTVDAVLDSMVDGPDSSGPREMESAPPAEVPEPEDAPAISASEAAKVVTIRLMARERAGFPGEKLVLTMRELGLQHGEFGIFHHPAGADDRDHDFSVASLVEPGAFDLTRIRSNTYPGVSIFMMLPGPRDGVEIFDDMMETSRCLAKQLDGDLLDEQGSSLSVQRERYLREEIIRFEHQGVS
jgi:cell division protein ZipA